MPWLPPFTNHPWEKPPQQPLLPRGGLIAPATSSYEQRGSKLGECFGRAQISLEPKVFPPGKHWKIRDGTAVTAPCLHRLKEIFIPL